VVPVGWPASGDHVWLHTPREMLEAHQARGEATDAHPGIAVIGDGHASSAGPIVHAR
jgi:hypothetical protein